MDIGRCREKKKHIYVYILIYNYISYNTDNSYKKKIDF